MQFAAERSAQTNAMSRGANTLHDGGLVLAAKNEHSTGFATLSHQYREQLFRAAHHLTRSHEDAEDAVQDTLLRAFVHMGDFEGRSNFGTWLTRITINSALMILRRKRATHETAMGDNNDFGEGLRYEIADDAPNPETRYAQTEELKHLTTAIHRLRPNLRVVLRIHLKEISMRETAETLGISLSAAKGRLFHAKKALRRSAIRKLADQPRFAGNLCALRPGDQSRHKPPQVGISSGNQALKRCAFFSTDPTGELIISGLSHWAGSVPIQETAASKGGRWSYGIPANYFCSC